MVIQNVNLKLILTVEYNEFTYENYYSHGYLYVANYTRKYIDMELWIG